MPLLKIISDIKFRLWNEVQLLYCNQSSINILLLKLQKVMYYICTFSKTKSRQLGQKPPIGK